jgi:hypothetical protein
MHIFLDFVSMHYFIEAYVSSIFETIHMFVIKIYIYIYTVLL